MHVCTFVGLLLAVLSCAESRQQKLQRSERFVPPYRPYPGMINNTAAGLYNSATEKCCLGSVHPNKKPAYDKCCGSGTMDSSKQLCCNDAIVPLVVGEACCGQTTINTDTATCCDDEEVPMKPEVIPFAKCCGKNAYDSRTQTCCSTDTEFNVVEGANEECCGDKSYESGEQTCCSDYKNEMVTYRVLPTSDPIKTQCCGDTLYDPMTESCCGEKLIATTDVCCGETVIDSATQLCAFVTSDDGKSTQKIVTKTDPNQTECCGEEPYDPNIQVCCSETNELITKSSPDHYACCGEESYSYTDGYCCGNKLIAFNESNSCCGTTGLYDLATQLCCYAYDESGTNYVSSIVEKKGDNDQCCGSKAYDMGKELCCGTEAFPISDDTQCCGNELYNTKDKICCSDTTVLPKEDGRDTCCLYGTTDANSECPRYPIYY